MEEDLRSQKPWSSLDNRCNFVEGLRVTSAENLKVTEMVLSGTINKEIIAHLNTCGGKAVGLSGKDGHLIEASKKDIGEGVDLGLSLIHI